MVSFAILVYVFLRRESVWVVILRDFVCLRGGSASVITRFLDGNQVNLKFWFRRGSIWVRTRFLLKPHHDLPFGAADQNRTGRLEENRKRRRESAIKTEAPRGVFSFRVLFRPQRGLSSPGLPVGALRFVGLPWRSDSSPSSLARVSVQLRWGPDQRQEAGTR